MHVLTSSTAWGSAVRRSPVDLAAAAALAAALLAQLARGPARRQLQAPSAAAQPGPRRAGQRMERARGRKVEPDLPARWRSQVVSTGRRAPQAARGSGKCTASPGAPRAAAPARPGSPEQAHSAQPAQVPSRISRARTQAATVGHSRRRAARLTMKAPCVSSARRPTSSPSGLENAQPQRAAVRNFGRGSLRSQLPVRATAPGSLQEKSAQTAAPGTGLTKIPRKILRAATKSALRPLR